MSKKKNRRNSTKNPALDPSLNLKSRRDVTDNRHYVKGVKNSNGEMVIPPLDDRAAKFLNDFNKEYYNADFSGPENVHPTLIDKDAVEDIKAQIRDIKAKRSKIYGKSPNTTTDEDREQANLYTEHIEEMEHFMNNMYPKRAAEHANNHRNYDLLNYAKRSNKYKLDSWDTLRDDELNELVSDFSDIMERDFDDD